MKCRCGRRRKEKRRCEVLLGKERREDEVCEEIDVRVCTSVEEDIRCVCGGI